MSPFLASTLVLIGGALILTLIAAGPTLWRCLKTKKKEVPHDRH